MEDKKFPESILSTVDPKIRDECLKLYNLLGELDAENKKDNPDMQKIYKLISEIEPKKHLLDILYPSK